MGDLDPPGLIKKTQVSCPVTRYGFGEEAQGYTRTRDCFEDFVKVIGHADAVLLAEVYAAGEAPIVAADGRALARALRVAGKVEPVFVDEIDAMPKAILDNALAGDVVMCMGAGSIGLVPAKVVDMLEKTQRIAPSGH